MKISELLSYLRIPLFPAQYVASKGSADKDLKKLEASRSYIVTSMTTFILYFILDDIIKNEEPIRVTCLSLKKISELIELNKDVSISDLESVFENLSKYTIRQKLKELNIIKDSQKTNAKARITNQQLKDIKTKMFEDPAFFEIAPEKSETVEISVNIKKGFLDKILKNMKESCFEEQALYISGKKNFEYPELEREKQEHLILTVKKIEDLSHIISKWYRESKGNSVLTIKHFIENLMSRKN